MRIEYHIDPLKRRIRCQASGGFHLFAFANYLERIMHDPDFNTNLDAIIVVLDEVTIPGPRTQTVIGKIFTVWAKRRRGAHWAFVLNTEESKQRAMQINDNLKITAVSIAFFTSEKEAIAWLESFPPPKSNPAGS